MSPTFTVEIFSKPVGFEPWSFVDFTYNDQPADAEPLFKPRPYAPTTFYSDEFGERNVLLSGLLLVDQIPMKVWKCESPDFRVLLNTGETVYVETTLASPSDRLALTQPTLQLHEAVKSWIKPRPDLQAKLGERSLVFFLSRPPSKRRFEATFAEVRDFIANEDFDEYPDSLEGRLVTPERYPFLHSLDCRISRTDLVLGGPTYSISSTTGGMDWNKLVAEARSILCSIERKRRVAQDWTTVPLWLIVYVEKTFWDPKGLAEALPDVLDDIAPFCRVIVCEDNAGLLIRAVDDRA